MQRPRVAHASVLGGHSHFVVQAHTSADARGFTKFLNELLGAQLVQTKCQIKKVRRAAIACVDRCAQPWHLAGAALLPLSLAAQLHAVVAAGTSRVTVPRLSPRR